MKDHLIYWGDKKIDELSREDLVAALNWLYGQWQDTLKEHARQLDMLADVVSRRGKTR